MNSIAINFVDCAIIVLYLIFIIWWGLRNGKSSDAGSYFLAGRTMPWWIVGLSLFAASISSTTLIGQSGDAYHTGVAVFNYNLTGVVVMVFFATFLLPLYIRSGIFTIPEFLERRFDKRSRYYFSGICIVGNIFLDAAGALYAAALIIKLLFPEADLQLIIIIFAVLAASYTIPGGLSSAINAELIQAVILIVGSVILTGACFANGGFDYLASLFESGDMSVRLIRPLTDTATPWLGLIVGMPVLGIYFWANNQTLVQRVLSARSVDEGRKGVMFAGALTLATLFIIVSKTFTTLETLTNAREARTWLLEELKAKGAIDGSDEKNAEAIKKHFVAVSTNLEKVAEFGIDPNNAFGFWNWVGGRYSVDSAVGTSLAVVFGPARFEEFLHGFHEIDEYFANTPFEKNVVVLLGMLNVWYRNFFKVASHAVLPYDQYLHRFPAYLQQLTMESNGKSVRWDGTPVTSETGEIFWGEPGTNGQHAFYQLIHQGTQLIPADFIAFVNTPNPTKDGDQDVHELFLGNYFAQTKALAFGKTADEVRAEGTPEEIVPARVFSGNRPTTSIFGVALTPFALGELIALYEHITFVEGTVWGLDSYDQWGVELGKQLAKQITPAISQDDDALAAQDASTQSLIKFYRANREF